MGFRRPKEETRTELQWREFRAAQEDLFANAGLPGFMADRRAWDDFLMHGFSEMPGGLADGVAFDVDELRAEQREALGQLVGLYLDRFDDPGVTNEIRNLMPPPESESRDSSDERALAEAVRAYLDAPTPGATAEEEAFLALSSALARLVGRLLEAQPGWPRYWWVDSFYADAASSDSISIISGVALQVEGVLIWGDEKNQWIDPLRGVIRLSPDADHIDSYEFQFGDAATGIGGIPYGEGRSRSWSNTRDWLYVLRSP